MLTWRRAHRWRVQWRCTNLYLEQNACHMSLPANFGSFGITAVLAMTFVKLQWCALDVLCQESHTVWRCFIWKAHSTRFLEKPAVPIGNRANSRTFFCKRGKMDLVRLSSLITENPFLSIQLVPRAFNKNTREIVAYFVTYKTDSYSCWIWVKKIV